MSKMIIKNLKDKNPLFTEWAKNNGYKDGDEVEILDYIFYCDKIAENSSVGKRGE